MKKDDIVNNLHQQNHQPLFASLTLHDGRIIKIYGYMPALELKNLMNEYISKRRRIQR